MTRPYKGKGKVNVTPIVKDFMRRHRLTMSAAAREIGVSPMTVWYWVNGTYLATPPYARMIRDAVERLAMDETRKTTSGVG